MVKKKNNSFTELKKYSEIELKEIIGDDDGLLKELQKYEYIKFDKEKELYTIKFVGVILINDKIFRCYPKYIPEDIPDGYTQDEWNIQKEKDFKETMRVIRKYHK